MNQDIEVFDMDTEKNSSAKTITMVVYALQAASFISGFSMIIAIVVNYLKVDDVKGTAYESHFRWQMRTFWFGLLWGILSIPLCFVLIGYFTLMANTVWVIYRIVKGFLNLNDGKEMYSQS